MKQIKLIVIFFALVIHGCSKDSSQDKKAESVENTAGAQIVKANCKVCHAQGINGAPVIGNKKMWASRTDKGLEALVTNASNGIGLMPAKGGNDSLTQEEMTLATEYMLNQLK